MNPIPDVKAVEESELRAAFWLIFETLPDDKKRSLKKWWAARNNPDVPYIQTHEDHTEGVWQGQAAGVSISLDIKSLRTGEYSLIEVAYHEIFHCVLCAEGRHFLSEYKEKEAKMERDVKRFTKKYYSSLMRNRSVCKKLKDDLARFPSLSGYNLAPL